MRKEFVKILTEEATRIMGDKITKIELGDSVKRVAKLTLAQQ